MSPSYTCRTLSTISELGNSKAAFGQLIFIILHISNQSIFKTKNLHAHLTLLSVCALLPPLQHPPLVISLLFYQGGMMDI